MKKGLTFVLFCDRIATIAIFGRHQYKKEEETDMQIIEIGRPLTENEVFGVKRADHYLNGWGDFAMIGENVFLSLDDVDVSKDIEGACREAKAQMKSILNRPPDFSAHLMKDNHVLILVGVAGAFGREAIIEEEFNDSKIKLAHSLALRGELLKACEKGEILALVDIE